MSFSTFRDLNKAQVGVEEYTMETIGYRLDKEAYEIVKSMHSGEMRKNTEIDRQKTMIVK